MATQPAPQTGHRGRRLLLVAAVLAIGAGWTAHAVGGHMVIAVLCGLLALAVIIVLLALWYRARSRRGARSVRKARRGMRGPRGARGARGPRGASPGRTARNTSLRGRRDRGPRFRWPHAPRRAGRVPAAPSRLAHRAGRSRGSAARSGAPRRRWHLPGRARTTQASARKSRATRAQATRRRWSRPWHRAQSAPTVARNSHVSRAPQRIQRRRWPRRLARRIGVALGVATPARPVPAVQPVSVTKPAKPAAPRPATAKPVNRPPLIQPNQQPAQGAAMSARIDAVTDAAKTNIAGFHPSSRPEVHEWFSALPEFLRELGAAFTSAAANLEDEFIHPKVIDMLRELGQVVAGTAGTAEETVARHIAEHSLWLNE